MKFNPPLFALAIGAFGIGVTEFSPMGLLPLITADLGVSIPVAGLLVTAYAIGVMLGAPVMTLSTGRIPRKNLLIGLMGIFTLGNLLSALSTDYWMLLVSRLITSLNHGAFFGVGSIVAASVVPEKKKPVRWRPCSWDSPLLMSVGCRWPHGWDKWQGGAWPFGA